ncbi:MAG: glycogen synthase [candidate division Zixibacteria bacterium SM23_73_2]|nr:MAG: glycogen synthase [candidate division Zixibacteria bacterium SM23_73_2]
MKIAIVSPEVFPFAKTGGLADVAGALPKEIAKLGHDVKVILPFYKTIDEKNLSLKNLNLQMPELPVASNKVKVKLKSLDNKESTVEFLFLDYKPFYNRENLYIDPKSGKDYQDNDERFILFSKGVIEILKSLDWSPDIIHCNDWQSALIPAYLKTIYAGDSFFKNTATVFSIHNIAYQGIFPKESFKKIGVAENLFYPISPFEFWGKVNFMKAGIIYADVINTVSEKYKEEIQKSSDFGYGLEGVLSSRGTDLYGILNGIDYSEWSPENDKYIPFKYSFKDLSGKEKNKKELLSNCGFPKGKKDIPLIGIISRLADQKGFDLLEKIGDEILSLNLRIVLLGTGELKYHDYFLGLERKYPEKIKVNLTFDNPLAHLIEAGSDMFLMPSKYEPCGLNQLYSLKYGTIPIVRETGGLADTIQDFNPKTKKGTGFVFKNYDPDELLDAIKGALKVYQDKKLWKKIMLSGMAKDFSWESSAKKYVELYKAALEKTGTLQRSK